MLKWLQEKTSYEAGRKYDEEIRAKFNSAAIDSEKDITLKDALAMIIWLHERIMKHEKACVWRGSLTVLLLFIILLILVGDKLIQHQDLILQYLQLG